MALDVLDIPFVPLGNDRNNIVLFYNFPAGPQPPSAHPSLAALGRGRHRPLGAPHGAPLTLALVRNTVPVKFIPEAGALTCERYGPCE
jgi:hypothetical protein